MKVAIETGFHDPENAYVNVTFDRPMTSYQVECANECARSAGQAFAKLLNELEVNGGDWIDHQSEVNWYDSRGDEVGDDATDISDISDALDVRCVQCMVYQSRWQRRNRDD